MSGKTKFLDMTTRTLNIINSVVRATRNERQEAIAEFIKAESGADHMSTVIRTVRMAEECIELMQALGMTKAAVLRMADYVYERPKGTIFQELGGVSVTLLALAQAWSYSLDAAEEHEIVRMRNLPGDHFAASNERKKAAGLDSLE